MSDLRNGARRQFVEKPSAPCTKVTRFAELEYLSDMLPQLRSMAIGLSEPTLAYLLEMAMLEAKLKLELNKEAGETIAYPDGHEAKIIKMR